MGLRSRTHEMRAWNTVLARTRPPTASEPEKSFFVATGRSARENIGYKHGELQLRRTVFVYVKTTFGHEAPRMESSEGTTRFHEFCGTLLGERSLEGISADRWVRHEGEKERFSALRER